MLFVGDPIRGLALPSLIEHSVQSAQSSPLDFAALWDAGKEGKFLRLLLVACRKEMHQDRRQRPHREGRSRLAGGLAAEGSAVFLGVVLAQVGCGRSFLLGCICGGK